LHVEEVTLKLTWCIPGVDWKVGKPTVLASQPSLPGELSDILVYVLKLRTGVVSAECSAVANER